MIPVVNRLHFLAPIAPEMRLLPGIAGLVQFRHMRQNQQESELCKIVCAAPHVMAALRAARDINLPDWAIAAGFIRAAVWDHLSGKGQSPVEDVDVLYHDPSDLNRAPEEQAEAKLRTFAPGFPWSVRNQARMHLRKGNAQYASTLDAMRFWLETPTCVGLRLETGDTLTVLAPYGLDDLFSRRIRPTPRGRRYADEYMARVNSKLWHKRWPGIEVERL